MWELNWLGRLGSARSGAAGHPIGIVTGSSEDRLSLYDVIKGKGYRIDISSSGIAYKNTFELTHEKAMSLDMGELFFKISHDTTEQVFNYNWQEKYASNDAALQSLGEASFGFAFRALGIAQNGVNYFICAQEAGGGFSVFKETGDGQFVPTVRARDTSKTYLSQVNSLCSLKTDAGQFIYAASGTENGLSIFKLLENGRLSHFAQIGDAQSLPVSGISEVKSIMLGGQKFLILAARDTHSLTVLHVGEDGKLTPADHILDDQVLRIKSISALGVTEFAGRGYVVAGGGDGGISVFELLPTGRLLHLVTKVSAPEALIEQVSELKFIPAGSKLFILLKDNRHSELGVFEFDLTDISGAEHVIDGRHNLLLAKDGARALEGRAGNDILVDAKGEQILRGDDGADIFVLRRDAERDFILDFDISEDRLDLSHWDRLYSLDQLNISSRNHGVRIVFHDEELIINSSDGRSITRSDLETADIVFMFRFDFDLTPRETSTPEPTQPPLSDETILSVPHEDTLFPIPPDTKGEYPELISAPYVPAEGPYFLTSMLRQMETTLINGASYNRATYKLATLGNADNNGMNGSQSAEHIVSLGGHDVIYALGGNDILDGGTGSDRLYGGNGHDTLIGGSGEDLLVGGNGNDVFLFYPTLAGERDVIADFDVARDKINIQNLTGNSAQTIFDNLRIVEVVDDLWIDVHGQAIILKNIDENDLNVDHFIF